jgi:hypothetical protein
MDPDKLIQTELFEIFERERGPHFLPTKGGGKITAKMRAFVVYYLESHKLAESAIRAGYSPKHAGSIANRLIQKSQVAELIKKMEYEALVQAGYSREKVIRELLKMAYFSLRELVNDDGTVKDPSEWGSDAAAAVDSIEVLEEYEGQGKNRHYVGRVKKVKATNKFKALELLTKLMNLVQDRIVFPDKDGNPQAPGLTVNQSFELVFLNPPDEIKRIRNELPQR